MFRDEYSARILTAAAKVPITDPVASVVSLLSEGSQNTVSCSAKLVVLVSADCVDLPSLTVTVNEEMPAAGLIGSEKTW